MDLTASSQLPSQKIPGNVGDFLKDYPDLLGKLSPVSQGAFISICSSIAHLRSRKSRNFFINTFHTIEALQGHPFSEEILRCAQVLSARNWGFIEPFFRAVKAIDEADFVAPWSDFTLRLAERDIDVAITFLTETPRVLAAFGKDTIFVWGGRALEALSGGSKMGKAAKAYWWKLSPTIVPPRQPAGIFF